MLSIPMLRQHPARHRPITHINIAKRQFFALRRYLTCQRGKCSLGHDAFDGRNRRNGKFKDEDDNGGGDDDDEGCPVDSHAHGHVGINRVVLCSRSFRCWTATETEP